MLKKTIILIIFCGALFQCGLALDINTNYSLGGVYSQDIIIQGDGITITLTQGVDIRGELRVIGSGQGVRIVCSDGKWMIRAEGDIYLKNATLDISSLETFGSTVGNKKVSLEKTKITASNRALFAENRIIRARFSSFISTGANSPVALLYTNDNAALKNPVLEFCYFQVADTSSTGPVALLNTYTESASASGRTFDLEGSCFNNTSKRYNTNTGVTYDYSPAGTAYDPTTEPDPVNGILKISASNVNFDKIIPPGVTLAVSGTLPAGRKLKLGYNEDTGVYEGGATLICSSSFTVVGADNAASSVGDEFHSEGTAAKPNEIQGGSVGLYLNLYGQQHNIKYTNFNNFSYAIRNYASGVKIQNNNFNNNIATAVRNYGANTTVQYNTFSAGISSTALRSEDTASSSNYSNNTFNTAAAGLDISTNGALTIQNNTFSSRSSAPLRIRAGNATVAGNTFQAADGATGVWVDSGNSTFTGNTISYTSGKGVRTDGGSPSFTGNIITGNNVPGTAIPAIYISGGTPTFRQNNIGGYTNGRALYLGASASVTVGNFSQNNFNSPNPPVYSSGTDATSPIYILEQNYWGAATPASANFTGGGGPVDYEPWLNAPYPGGTLIFKRAEPISGINPSHQSQLSSIPANIYFGIDDLGYHNGTPLEYQFRIADSASGLLAATISTNSGFKAKSTIQHAVSGLLRGKTYYWQARVQNTTDHQGYTDWLSLPTYQFSINEPRLILNLSAWDTSVGNTQVSQRSAGEAIYYRLAFKNDESSLSTTMSPVTVTAILPEDVYWNGDLRVTGLNSGNGSVTLRAYENIAGGAPKTYTTTLSGNADLTYTSLGIPQGDVYKYRRFELTITTLPAQQGGAFIYGSIVK
ncbi:MAG: right-handed parallel beta-helix repeat-containing protein [Candidatus Margulisbacteria bacterium]|jgi:hypothetical protein|nr:right-handed parallel beta-helix repeat-containing protein [Candidatus Margulisiibacteriota bacterium]